MKSTLLKSLLVPLAMVTVSGAFASAPIATNDFSITAHEAPLERFGNVDDFFSDAIKSVSPVTLAKSDAIATMEKEFSAPKKEKTKTYSLRVSLSKGKDGSEEFDREIVFSTSGPAIFSETKDGPNAYHVKIDTFLQNGQVGVAYHANIQEFIGEKVGEAVTSKSYSEGEMMLDVAVPVEIQLNNDSTLKITLDSQ